MTFEEKLDRAKTGSHAAYESICLGSVDTMYAAALIALKNDQTARGVVVSAIKDGYSGVSRIKDERHLRSWLAHELTKNAVDKLRELKTSGVSHTASGVFAEAGKLADVDRLVFALKAAFGYGTREISVLTGMSEATISEKLASAEKRLGSAYGDICRAASSCTAPAPLKERYSGFDRALEKLEAEAYTPAPVPAPAKKPETAEVQTAPETPEEPEVPAPAARETSDEAPDTEENTFGTDDEAVFSDEDDEEYDESADDDQPVFEEAVEEEEEPAGTELNAATFIAVVSAERMKGSEFLRLIGNTRISNSAYREIEQNPNLTKKRLIELLEQSHLTENDYYKLLTAIKDRREVLDLKEESRRAHELAGLYDGSMRGKYRRKRREKPKSELELAIGLGEKKQQEQPPTYEQSKADEDESDYKFIAPPGIFPENKPAPGTSPVSCEAAAPAAGSPDDGGDTMSETPVDPFAAIAASESVKHIMAAKAGDRRISRPETEEEDVPEVKEISSAAEIPAPGVTAISDTRPFETVRAETTREAEEYEQDVPDGIAESAYEDVTDEASEGMTDDTEAAEDFGFFPAAMPDDSFVRDDEPDIETTPVTDSLSVTQMIKDYSTGERVSDEVIEQVLSREEHPHAKPITVERPHTEPAITEPRHAEPIRPEPTSPAKEEEPVGFRPDFDLDFDEASLEMSSDDSEEDLSFSFPGGAANNSEEDDDDDEGILATSELPRIDEARFSARPETPAAPSVQYSAPTAEKTDIPDEALNDEENDDDNDFDKAPARKRYKGNEYFIDDNEYYEGVNRGKIITCVVLALLLAAGSAGMKYLPKNDDGEAVPAIAETTAAEDTPVTEQTTADAPEEEPFEETVTLTALGSYSEMTDSRYEGSIRSSELGAASEYLRASSAPFGDGLIKDIAQFGAVSSDKTAFVYSRGDSTFRAADLSGNEADSETDTDTDDSVAPKTPFMTQISSDALHAFTTIDGKLYAVCDKLTDGGSDPGTTEILVFDATLMKTGDYTLTGAYAGSVVKDGKLTVATCFGGGEGTPSYTANGEVKDIPASDIYALDGAVHNAVHILYTVGGGDPVAVLGGVKEESGSRESIAAAEDGFVLAAADEGVTYAVNISSDMKMTGAARYKGDAFCADCIGEGGMIGQTVTDGVSAITAYKNGKLITVPDETAKAIAWSESGTAYIVTEHSGGQKMLYGIDMSGDEPTNAVISASDIYSDKLIQAGRYLAGLKAEPSPDGERAGLRLSLYEYDGELKEKAYSIIELDKDTPRENLKYLGSPAEQDTTLLGTDETGTLFAVPTVYFDGYSEVERVVLLEFDGTTFSQAGEYITYDEKSSVLCPILRDGRLYIITDNRTTEK